MKKYFFLIFFFSFFLSLTNNLQSNIQSSIILKVDKKIITSFDVKNKILSTLIIAGNDITQANIDQLKEQTLENLIYIKLKEIELERFDFKVNKQRVNKFINRVSGNNKEKITITNSVKQIVNNPICAPVNCVSPTACLIGPRPKRAVNPEIRAAMAPTRLAFFQYNPPTNNANAPVK